MPPRNEDADDWDSYRRLVLSQLADIKRSQEDLTRELGLVKLKVNTLYVASGVLGALAGGLVTVVSALFNYFGGKKL